MEELIKVLFFGMVIILVSFTFIKFILEGFFWTITGSQQMGKLFTTLILLVALMAGGKYLLNNGTDIAQAIMPPEIQEIQAVMSGDLDQFNNW
jgi:Na+-transporting methylmalonyl-CoA/oxaloacetate decarboxylase gamma subunit